MRCGDAPAARFALPEVPGRWRSPRGCSRCSTALPVWDVDLRVARRTAGHPAGGRSAVRSVDHAFGEEGRGSQSMGWGKKRKRKKIATHKRKKRLRKNRHKKRTWQK